jgi:CHAT domain-containing protein
VKSGATRSLSRNIFTSAVTAAASLSDACDAAMQVSQLGLSWLTAVLDGVENDVQPALDCFQRALSLCPEKRDPVRFLSDHYHVGAAYLLQTPESVVALEHAIAEFRLVLQYADPNALKPWLKASALNSLCAALRRNAVAGRADYDEVLAVAADAVTEWRLMDRPADLARALLNAGNAHLENPEGDPDDNAARANEFYEDAVLHAARSGELRLEAQCRYSAALSLRDRAGYQPDEDLAKAAVHLERAIAIYREGEDEADWAEAVAVLASLQVDERARFRRASQEQIRGVINLLRNALRFLGADARPSSRASALFYLGQALLEDDGDRRENSWQASNAFREARLLWTGLQRNLLVAYAEEAEANALAESPELRTHRKAERLYKSAIRRLGPTHPLQRFRIERNLGFLKMEEGSWRAASRAFGEAVKMASDSGFLAFQRSGFFREGDLAECYSSLAYCELRIGNYEKALQTLEASRQMRSAAVDRDFSVAAALRAIRDEHVVVPLLSPVGSAAVVLSPGVRNLTEKNVIHLPGLDQLYASLHPVRSRGRPGWLHDLTVWRGDQSSGTRGSRESFLDELLENLWTVFAKPVLMTLVREAGHKLVIVPQGGLQIFPIHAAYEEEAGGRRYVLTDWSVRYVPSLRFLSDAAKRRDKAFGRTLAVGLSRYRDPRLRKLALAEAEAEMVLRIAKEPAGGKLLHSSAVRRETVIEEIKHARTLHFACHATWNPDPGRSALQLWAERSGEREELTIDALEQGARLDNVRLVVLSACESGVVEHVFAPDEFAGFPGAFLRTGCGGVISSLWAVHDVASFLLWSRFYKELRDVVTPDLALEAAQRWLRNLTVRELKSIHAEFTGFEELLR